MQRNDDHRDGNLIDLGVVSEATKGPAGLINDTQEGQRFSMDGLTDD